MSAICSHCVAVVIARVESPSKFQMWAKQSMLPLNLDWILEPSLFMFMTSKQQLICLEFDNIYKRLDIKIVERGESFYQPLMPGVVADLEAKGRIKVYF